MNDAHFTNFNRTRCLIDIIDDNWARDTLDFEGKYSDCATNFQNFDNNFQF